MFFFKTITTALITILLSSTLAVVNALEIEEAQNYEKIDTPISLTTEKVKLFEKSQTIPKDVKQQSTPGIPENVALVHARYNYALIAWDAPSDNGGETIIGYRVGISEDNFTFQYFDISDEYVMIEGFMGNTKYYYTVEAYNISGYSASQTGFFSTPASTSVPTSPLLVTSGNATDESIELSWNIPQKSGTAVTAYNISYSIDQENWVTISNPSTLWTRESYTIRGLNKGTTYYIKIAGVNSNGQGNWSSTVTSATTGTISNVPGMPTNLGVTSFNQSTVALAWYAPVNNGGEQITDYIIQYKSRASTVWTTFNDGLNNNTGATITGLFGGTTYNFRIAAVNAIGMSSYTELITQTTAPKTAPDAPTGLKIIDGYRTSFQISWNPPANNGGSTVKDYIVQYKLNTSNTWTTFNDGVSTSTKALITGVLNNRVYHYRVAAVNNTGTSTYSLTNFIVMEPPARPLTYFIQKTTDTTVEINIGHVYNQYKPNVRDSIVQYRKAGETTWRLYNDGPGVSNVITVSGLSSNTSYEFRVSSANTSGWGAFSPALSTTTLSTISSTPPNSLQSLDTTKNSVLLSWSPSASTGISDYIIQYSTDGNAWTTFDDGVSVSTNALVTPLSTNSSYSFRIATNVSGVISSYSETFNVTTTSGFSTPEAPTGLTVLNVDASSVYVTWNQVENYDSKVTSYIVGVSQDGINYTYHTASNKAGYATVTNMKSGTKYWITVNAVNANGIGQTALTNVNTL